jgi:hypothetical protein
MPEDITVSSITAHLLDAHCIGMRQTPDEGHAEPVHRHFHLFHMKITQYSFYGPTPDHILTSVQKDEHNFEIIKKLKEHNFDSTLFLLPFVHELG